MREMKTKNVEKTNTPDSVCGESRENHPAFGQVAISRVQHGPRKFSLYGAASDTHMTTIQLTISRSERIHGLSMDRYFKKGELIQVEMTPMQFSDLMTSFNIGLGTPCTIRCIGNEDVPDIPVEDNTEIGRIRDGFIDRVRKSISSEKMTLVRNEIKDILSKKAILKADRDRLALLTESLFREFEGHIPFVMGQFTEAAERVGSEMRRDIAEFTHSVMEEAGMGALANMHVEDQVLMLSGGHGESQSSDVDGVLDDGESVEVGEMK